MPKLSVIVPTYNRAGTIVEALDSVFNQREPGVDFEVLVIDDGSTDETEELLKQKYGDKIIYKKIEHSGKPAVVRNVGLKLAQGEFIAFQDSDDIWYPDKLALQLPAFQDPEIVLVYANATYVGSNTKLVSGVQPVSDNAFIRMISAKPSPVPTLTVIIRKNVIDKVGMFNERKLIVGTDTDYWVRVATTGKFKYIDKVLAEIRRDGSNISSIPSESGDAALLKHELNRIDSYQMIKEDLKLTDKQIEAIDYRIAELHHYVAEICKRNGKKPPFDETKIVLPKKPEILKQVDELYDNTVAGRADKLLRSLFGWSPKLYKTSKTVLKTIAKPFRKTG